MELALEDTVHILDFLLLLELYAVLLLLLALSSEAVLSRREVSLLKVLVTSENRLAELTGEFWC